MTTLVPPLPPASPPHSGTTTASPPSSPPPRLVSPNPEIQLIPTAAVLGGELLVGDGDDAPTKDEQLLSKIDAEELDACDLDFGLEEEAPAGMFASNTEDIFPMEVLSKMSSFSEMVESLQEPPKKAEDVISEALTNMSLEDREKIVRDLYGIEKIKAPTITSMTNHVTNSEQFPVTTQELEQDEEDPQFLQTKLQEMDAAIQRMKNSYGWNIKMAALELAEQQNLDYTRDPTFRLQFLRVDRFDVSRAASRFIRYFDWKLELFGEHTLTRAITWEDLTPEDQAMLRKGYMQRLPVRDRAGRSIFVVFYMGQEYESPQSKARQYFYMLSSTDEETDKKGQIAIFFKFKDIVFKQTKGLGGLTYIFRFVPEFPVRFDAFHKFKEDKPNSTMAKILDFCILLMNQEYRARTLVHVGKYNDWVTSLMSYGVPHDVIPVTQSCKIKTKNHMEYLSMRMKKEQMLATNSGVTCEQLVDLPTRRDVLLGKGRPIQFSCGNQALSMIVDGYLDRYHNQCTKVEKTALANEILRMLHSNGVRFLSKEPHGIWTEVSHEVARDKLSHMFRHQKKKCSTSGSSNKAGTSIRREAPEAAVAADVETESQEQAKRVKL